MAGSYRWRNSSNSAGGFVIRLSRSISSRVLGGCAARVLGGCATRVLGGCATRVLERYASSVLAKPSAGGLIVGGDARDEPPESRRAIHSLHVHQPVGDHVVAHPNRHRP